MNSAGFYRISADVVLITHAAFVAFVILGLILVFYGGARQWSWIRNPWFRLSHLAAIALVVVQAWFGMTCPLTTLEMMLRERAEDAVYGGSFVAHWLHQLLYYDGPDWVFTVCYTVFGLLVAASWICVRPTTLRRKSRPVGS